MNMAARMSLNDYLIQCAENLRESSWRTGQMYFNVLHAVHPELSEKVRATKIDPFHRDERLPEFFAFIAHHWDDE